MDYARQVLSTWGFRKEPQLNDNVVAVTRFDAYLNFAYKVLLWDDPVLSWTTLGAVHVLFWVIVHFEIKLYGFIFTMILAAFLLDTYFERVGLQEKRTAETEALRRCGLFLRDLVLYLKALRTENPSVFCGTMCAVFLALSILARNVSGYFLAYLSILAAFFLPTTVQKIPPEYFAKMKETLRGITSNKDLVAETELIPFLKEFTERDADQDSVVTDKTTDSIANSLITGITSMPSHLDREGSLDGLEEDDLIPTHPKHRCSKSHETISDDSDSSFSSHSKRMSFSLHHFNGDRSQLTDARADLSSTDSDDDDEFTRHYTTGLSFPTAVDQTDGNDGKQQGSSNPLGSAILKTLETIVQPGRLLFSASDKVTSAARRDSDSDFEIIDSDEVDSK